MTPAPGSDKCVGCRRQPIDPQWRPFCSERCKLLDLARWADGAYSVPGEMVTDDGAAHEENGPQDG